MSEVQAITSQDFQQMQQDGGIYLIDFWAPWCPPCKTMDPIIDQLAADEDLSQVNFVKANVDEENQLATQFGVRSIPTFALVNLKPGKEFSEEEDVLKTFNGAQQAFDFKMAIQDAISQVSSESETADAA
jgi:thioredoxin